MLPRAAPMICVLALAGCAPVYVAEPSAYSPPYDRWLDTPSYASEPVVIESNEVFITVLSPHGDWLETSSWGLVWVPSPGVVGAGWQPYSRGHWVLTEYGWTWVSDFTWGWATFHYGRWVRDPGLGWVWVPGRVWAPAWVRWRVGPTYVGWAPLAPDDTAETLDLVHDIVWLFVELIHLLDADVHEHVIHEPNQVAHCLTHTRDSAGGESGDTPSGRAGPHPQLVQRADPERFRLVPASDLARPVFPPRRGQAAPLPRRDSEPTRAAPARAEPGSARLAPPPKALLPPPQPTAHQPPPRPAVSPSTAARPAPAPVAPRYTAPPSVRPASPIPAPRPAPAQVSKPRPPPPPAPAQVSKPRPPPPPAPANKPKPQAPAEQENERQARPPKTVPRPR